MMGGAPLWLFGSPELPASSHHSVKEFSGDAEIDNDLLLRFSSPMTANDLIIEMSFKFPPLKFAT